MHAIGCAGCHRLDEQGDGVPDVRRVGWYADGDRLRKVLDDPQSVFPGTRMPRIEAPLYARDAMVANLTLQRTPLPSSPDAVLQDVCRLCHGEPRDPKAVVLSRRPPDFPSVKGRLTADEFATAVTEGREGTAMAPWGRVLSRAFVLGLYDRLDARREAK
jgi:mono/diheme cytochrome c family protein